MANVSVSIVRKPRALWRILLSIPFLVTLTVGIIARSPQTVIQTKAAIAAVNSGTAQNAVSSAIISSDVAGWMVCVSLIVLALTWPVYILDSIQYYRARPRRKGDVSSFSSPLLLFGLLGCFGLTGCGDYQEKKYEEVAPNEAAFVIPLTGTADEQAQFKSLDYLTKAKVAAKRIEIPTEQHNTGRGPGSYIWLPTVKVIKVDRSPITREWTRGKNNGTSPKDQAIAVESLESINFRAGVSLTVSIRDEDAPKFLYFYFGKKLEDVVDQNMRSFVQGVLSREFGNLTLAECAKSKAKVFKTAYEETKTQFLEKGITLEYLSSSEGLEYDDPKIQESINKKFQAENDILVAKTEALANEERNKVALSKAKNEAEIKLMQAKADAEAAQEFVKAGDAMMIKAQVDIAKAQAEAMKTAAEKWNGSVPNSILPQGTNMMFGLDQQRPTPAQLLTKSPTTVPVAQDHK